MLIFQTCHYRKAFEKSWKKSRRGIFQKCLPKLLKSMSQNPFKVIANRLNVRLLKPPLNNEKRKRNSRIPAQYFMSNIYVSRTSIGASGCLKEGINESIEDTFGRVSDNYGYFNQKKNT